MSKKGWWMHESQLNLIHVFHLQQAYENQRHLMYVLYLTGRGRSSGCPCQCLKEKIKRRLGHLKS